MRAVDAPRTRALDALNALNALDVLNTLNALNVLNILNALDTLNAPQMRAIDAHRHLRNVLLKCVLPTRLGHALLMHLGRVPSTPRNACYRRASDMRYRCASDTCYRCLLDACYRHPHTHSS